MLVLLWMILGRFTNAFGLFLIMELPTCVLSLGQVNPALRHDLIFGGSFFATRICLHIYLFEKIFSFRHLSNVWMIIFAAFLLHIHWFYGWIKQQIRLLRKNKDKAE